MEKATSIQSYQDLAVWRLAMALVKRVYGAARLLPKHEIYGLAQQLRRSAVSIPSNIAEGYGRGSLPDYLSFLRIARGSLYELETQVLLAGELTYLTQKQSLSLLDDTRECAKALHGLIKALAQKRRLQAATTRNRAPARRSTVGDPIA